MALHNELGAAGEERAVRFLEEKGYQVLSRNWHGGHKELDIIALDGETLVVAEVKTRSGMAPLSDLTQMVTPVKINRLVSAANRYVQKHGIDLRVRFDVLFLRCFDGHWSIDHIEDAFDAPLR